MKKINNPFSKITHSIAATLTAVALTTLNACYFNEEDIFDQSTSQRIETALNQYSDILTKATNGWLFEYYPGGEDHDIGGVTMLVRFSDSENVTVVSDTKVQGYTDTDETEAGTYVSSKYTLKQDQGPVLSFSTYNVLIHFWAEPRGGLDTDGYEGDFEFVIVSATDTEITLTGKKHGTQLYLKRLDDSVDWDTYINNCLNIRNLSQDYGTLVGYNADNQFTPSAYSQENVITFSTTDTQGTTTKTKVSFTYTDVGIRLYDKTTVNGVQIYDFAWDDNTKTFTAVDNADIILRYEQPEDYVDIDFYTDNSWTLYYQYNFGRADTTENVSFKRIEGTDSLQMEITSSGLEFTIRCGYNHTTGMIEFNTQFVARVILMTTDGATMNAYIHLCPWDEDNGTMYLTEKAGIVSYTTQMSPRILEFTDNGRLSGSTLTGFVFYAFTQNDRSSEQLGVLETYGSLKLTQQITETDEEDQSTDDETKQLSLRDDNNITSKYK